MPRVFLIRHGQSTFNALYGENGVDPMHVDARLSALGHDQVRDGAARARSLGVDLVVSSPLTRAIQTGIGMFGAARHLLIEAGHTEHVVASCDVGRPTSVLKTEYDHLDFDHLDETWWPQGPLDELGIPIESVEDCLRRVASFKAWLAARPEDAIAVVGHSAFFWHFTGGRRFANCEIVEWSLGQARELPESN